MKSKFKKIFFQIVAFVCSVGMIIYTYIDEDITGHDWRYADDYFTIAIFALILLVPIFSKIGITYRYTKYRLVVLLCSLWLLVSSNYHFITAHEWYTAFVLNSIINILSFSAFVVAMSSMPRTKRFNIIGNKINIAALISMGISVIASIITKKYFTAITTVLSALLLLSKIDFIVTENKEFSKV